MRKADGRDHGPMRDALLRLQEYSKKYKFAVGVDYTSAEANVLHEIDMGNAYVIDGYLVLVSKVVPWYSTLPILQEWLVLKIYGGGDVNNIPPALLTIAAEQGCKVIITGDSSPVNIMATVYNKACFTPLTQSFYKEVP